MNVSIPPLPPGYDHAITYWDRPLRAGIGDPNDADLYVAVGLALSRWELGEMYLAELFGFLVGSESWAAQAYGMAASAILRHGMLQAAADAYFDDPRRRQHDRAVLGTILKNYYEAAGRRNDIAHGVVTRIATRGWPSRGHFLLPPDYDTRPTKRRASIERFWGGRGYWVANGLRPVRNNRYLARAAYAYTSTDIKGITAKFEGFAGIVAQFTIKLRAVREHGQPEFRQSPA